MNETIDASNKNRRRNLMVFTEKKNQLSNNEKQFEENEDDSIRSREVMLQILNCEEVAEQVFDFIYMEDNTKFEVNQSDYERTQYSKHNSFLNFYEKFKKRDEYIRKDVGNIATPSFNFIKAAKEENIIPFPVGLVKREGIESKVNINHFRMGDSYLTSLSQSLKLSDHVTDLNLAENRLTGSSIIPLFKAIMGNPKQFAKIFVLDLSYNKLGKNAVEWLILFMENKEASLEHLNLEANCLGDVLVCNILDCIAKNLSSKMRYLNFGQNNVTDESGRNLANCVKSCEYLQVLILYSNQIKNFGASLIVSELKRHYHLKIFDISWNLIGNNLLDYVPSREELLKSTNDSTKIFLNAELHEMLSSMEFPAYTPGKKKLPPLKNIPSPFCKELGELFRERDTELIHLDISHNNIGHFDCSYLSEEVKYNHTILGIHVDGNDMYTDELGFLYPIEKSDYQPNHFANSQVFYRIDKEHPLIKSNILSVKKIRAKNNCWICEGWKEAKFTYKPLGSEGPFDQLKVKLHLDFESYKPCDMILRQNSFICHRMCPPGDLMFYFTLNGVPVENYRDITHNLKEAIVHSEPAQETDERYSDNEDMEKPEPKQYIITKVAKTFVQINREVIIVEGYLNNLKNCVPRPEKKIVVIKRPRTPWTFPISVWNAYGYAYEGDSEDHLNDVFEFDFKRGQYTKEKELNSDQIIELKSILRANFRKIIDSYKNMSAYLGWHIWQIGQNSIVEFANAAPGLLDSKYLINDVLVKVTEVKSNLLDKEEKKRNAYDNIPDNIIRHQWMNLLVKIAKDKYLVRSKIMNNLPDAVKYSFDNHYLPFLSQFDTHSWRIERYYNEFVDNVLKAYMPILDAVFKSQVRLKIIGRKDSMWMWLEEFSNICQSLIDNEFPVREIPICFNLAMKLQINEIDSDRHYNMTFPEFLEALARVADKLSAIPDGESPNDWAMQARVDQHLSTKIENIMIPFSKLITNPDYKAVREKWQTPQRDEETGLLKYDPTNQLYAAVLPKFPRNKGLRLSDTGRNSSEKPTIIKNDNEIK